MSKLDKKILKARKQALQDNVTYQLPMTSKTDALDTMLSHQQILKNQGQQGQGQGQQYQQSYQMQQAQQHNIYSTHQSGRTAPLLVKLINKHGFVKYIDRPEPLAPYIILPINISNVHRKIAEAAGVPVISHETIRFVRTGHNEFTEE